MTVDVFPRRVQNQSMSYPPPQMPQMPIAYYTPQVMLPFVDRRTRLTVMGVLFAVVGAFMALMTLAVPLTLMMQMRLNPQFGNSEILGLVLATSFYLVLSVGLIWLAVGCFLRRRWTRPIVLSLGVLVVLIGVLALLAMAVLAPSLSRAFEGAATGGNNAPAGPTVPTGFGMIVVVITLAVMFVFYVLIPAIVTAVFWPQSVRQTLEHYDTRVRWTDACPLPVLGLAIKLWLVGLLSAPMAFYPAIPVGPVLLSGVWLIVVALGVMVLFLAIGTLVYRQRLLGWWLMLLSTLALCGVMAWTSRVGDFAGYFAALKAPAEQQAVMNSMIENFPTIGLLFAGVFAAAVLAYALGVKKYFVR